MNVDGVKNERRIGIVPKKNPRNDLIPYKMWAESNGVKALPSRGVVPSWT